MTDLSARLARLRREAGAPRPAPLGGLAERERRRRAAAERALAARLGARQPAPGLLALEARLPLPRALAAAPLEALPEAAGVAPDELVFIDTETTGLAGGSGTAVFLLGLARIEGGALRLRQLLLTAFAGEAALYEAAAPWLRGAALVSYNGRSFDLPLIQARARLAGVALPAHRGHIDLLHGVRRAWGHRLADCRLARVEAEILGRPRRGDLPGSEAPAAWLAWLRLGEAATVARVVAHNRRDVAVLAELLARLAHAHRAPHRHGADGVGVARALARAGRLAEACAVIAAAEGVAAMRERAELLRRAGCTEAALPLWRRLAAVGDAGAVERLAKYHEHVRRDFAAALAWAERLPPGPARARRCARLRRRLAAGGGSR
ncbi:ribonuclease H-like domain-containing protein [Inmirania thermothiophila]|uniref:YprB ribonuclease H-like domain-containing protein n=1 Tax=Inmirania thermothiophila TaxID=1750597 RepID=A0A3N1Y208_9GAMM|nr:ribonuclease H-like domain-containing protein [Inmirania thermothiophila]ROR32548.1 hypothetical protein EDC57_1750 [Inmirania thermothiophila]